MNLEDKEGCIFGGAIAAALVGLLFQLALIGAVIYAIIKGVQHFF